MNKLMLVLVSGLFVSFSAVAADGGGSDGCGLGWQVTQKKSLVGTTTRGTTNLVVPPVFGMTSGTIGCDQHSIARRDVPAAQFVASNYDALMMDMAQGEGESLAALANTLGCGNTAAFGEMTRREFSSLTEGADSLELVRRLREEAAKNAALGCSA
jgi:hypothetical protein